MKNDILVWWLGWQRGFCMHTRVSSRIIETYKTMVVKFTDITSRCALVKSRLPVQNVYGTQLSVT